MGMGHQPGPMGPGNGPPPPPSSGGMNAPSDTSNKPGEKSSTPDDSKFDTYMSKFQPSKPDPWLDVAEAGFAMAAGKSPHALENIGAGAAKGVAAYEQQKQEAAKEAIQGGETAARLSDNDVYRRGMLANTANRNNNYLQGIQLRHEDRQEQISNMIALQLARLNATEGNGNWLPGRGLDDNGKEVPGAWFTPKNGGAPIFHPMTTERSILTDNTVATDGAKVQQGDRRLQLSQDMNTWRMQHGNATDAETQRYHDALIAKGYTQEDIDLAKSMNPIKGNKNFPDPHAAAQALRDKNAPPQRAAPSPQSGQPAQGNQSTQWAPAPADPTLRETNHTYMLPNGKIGVWRGTGWELKP